MAWQSLSLTTVVLPHVRTARQGVELMAVREQGAAGGNIIAIADRCLVYGNLSGHQYVAIKFPD